MAIYSFFGLVLFAVVRGSSFHWTDAFLSTRLGSLMIGHILQAFLLTVTSAAAIADLSEARFGTLALINSDAHTNR
jgi:hypothetical protein